MGQFWNFKIYEICDTHVSYPFPCDLGSPPNDSSISSNSGVDATISATRGCNPSPWRQKIGQLCFKYEGSYFVINLFFGQIKREERKDYSYQSIKAFINKYE